MKLNRLALLLGLSAPLCVLAVAGCNGDDVEVARVPPKDIPKEAYNRPIPRDVSKYMSGSMPGKKSQAKFSVTK